MKIARFLTVAAAALILMVGTVSVAQADASRVTVGQFLVEIAKAKNLNPASPAAADGALRAAGYDLPKFDLNATLTEGAVAAISNSLGIRVSTSNPTATFGPSQVQTYFSAFGSELGKTDPLPDPQPTPETHKPDHGTDPLTKGKGKKKGLLKRSPSDPV